MNIDCSALSFFDTDFYFFINLFHFEELLDVSVQHSRLDSSMFYCCALVGVQILVFSLMGSVR